MNLFLILILIPLRWWTPYGVSNIAVWRVGTDQSDEHRNDLEELFPAFLPHSITAKLTKSTRATPGLRLASASSQITIKIRIKIKNMVIANGYWAALPLGQPQNTR